MIATTSECWHQQEEVHPLSTGCIVLEKQWLTAASWLDATFFMAHCDTAAGTSNEGYQLYAIFSIAHMENIVHIQP